MSIIILISSTIIIIVVHNSPISTFRLRTAFLPPNHFAGQTAVSLAVPLGNLIRPFRFRPRSRHQS
ncbi:hypothetical protein BU24DRAFT_221918 [Aaosphaeria arxii CBS 175.79]|uniref:Uncharacterized protein n=1 Tax=Aaosphaeria arxii CBS 175.79 TaxID=1450172 RepID=A0A6A5XPG2_9PLEO|nr:uncharacterized protein BU24DRAFT_221918 [Aaosphaeria arxii CBS 175.79]KAF2014796.1 hypothetical protein BU24DRAFT_221918 [Aaosphaeria arxii CBS 175.79]